MSDRVARLPPIDAEHGTVNVVIDTPKGSRNKYKYDPTLGLFRLAHALPAGASFPFDFGDVPGTLGGDGDPIDVLVLMEHAAFSGCLVPSRLIGAIEAEQTQDGRTFRNDRLIAVAAASREYQDVGALDAIGATLLRDLEHFFVSYNRARGRRFTPLRAAGPERAVELLREGIDRARSS
jgi:inorganic pyrophosphatase